MKFPNPAKDQFSEAFQELKPAESGGRGLMDRETAGITEKVAAPFPLFSSVLFSKGSTLCIPCFHEPPD